MLIRIMAVLTPVTVIVYDLAKSAKSQGDDCVVHWKCENNTTLKEVLMIPITNDLKEKALRTAAKQRMTEREKQRRSLTG